MGDVYRKDVRATVPRPVSLLIILRGRLLGACASCTLLDVTHDLSLSLGLARAGSERTPRCCSALERARARGVHDLGPLLSVTHHRLATGDAQSTHVVDVEK